MRIIVYHNCSLEKRVGKILVILPCLDNISFVNLLHPYQLNFLPCYIFLSWNPIIMSNMDDQAILNEVARWRKCERVPLECVRSARNVVTRGLTIPCKIDLDQYIIEHPEIKFKEELYKRPRRRTANGIVVDNNDSSNHTSNNQSKRLLPRRGLKPGPVSQTRGPRGKPNIKPVVKPTTEATEKPKISADDEIEEVYCSNDLITGNKDLNDSESNLGEKRTNRPVRSCIKPLPVYTDQVESNPMVERNKDYFAKPSVASQPRRQINKIKLPFKKANFKVDRANVIDTENMVEDTLLEFHEEFRQRLGMQFVDPMDVCKRFKINIEVLDMEWQSGLLTAPSAVVQNSQQDVVKTRPHQAAERVIPDKDKVSVEEKDNVEEDKVTQEELEKTDNRADDVPLEEEDAPMLARSTQFNTLTAPQPKPQQQLEDSISPVGPHKENSPPEEGATTNSVEKDELTTGEQTSLKEPHKGEDSLNDKQQPTRQTTDDQSNDLDAANAQNDNRSSMI